MTLRHRFFLSWPAAAFAATLLLSACAMPHPAPPVLGATPAQFKEALPASSTSAAVVTVPDNWWTLFNDPMLDDLQRRLPLGNETLKASAAQIAGARAVFEASRSAGWPALSAGLSATRSGSNTSNNNNNSSFNGGTLNGNSGAQSSANSLALSLAASWEIDLWGRLAQAQSGAQATLEASEADLAAARLSAQALLAQTYFSLRAADALGALQQRTLQAYERALSLTQARYQSGVAARSDVLQAQTQRSSAQAQAADTAAQRAQFEHAIAVLLGIAPSSFTLPVGDLPPAAPAVPELLPAELLQRRPDIAAARRRVAAAYTQIGVADAAFFPSLTLSASAGLRNAALAGLISAPNTLWSFGASLSEAIFDNGQRRLASAQARASADQLTANYRQTVLTALQEVEDNLVLAAQLQRQTQLQQEALQAAQRTLDITLAQYRAGTVSYLNVVTAQTTALASESNWLNSRNRELAAVNQLLKNVAGRWEGGAGG